MRSRIADFHDNFSLIQGATLTLLGLVIAFAFSMAVGRYDQRNSPRGGVIPVSPRNLLALAQSLRGQ